MSSDGLAPRGRNGDWLSYGKRDGKSVNNAVLKTLVAKTSEAGLSPKTISDNLT
jgi:hypothetical protein